MRSEVFREPWKEPTALRDAQLVLVFGQRAMLDGGKWIEDLRHRHPSAQLVGCSTAGEILGEAVGDLGLVGVAIRFERTTVKVARVDVREYLDSETAAAFLAAAIDKKRLVHVMVFCDGQLVNGSELVRGLMTHLPKGVAVTGGLAGDGTRFERTYVSANGHHVPGMIAAVTFHSLALEVGYGSLGGWDPSGGEMLVTRARGNHLEQIDGRSALGVYRALLGEAASRLPASGLLFPLYVRTQGGHAFVRTLLNIDEKSGSLVFAGDVPVGSRVQLMRANFDRLIAGAQGAAARAMLPEGPELAILISCVGRRLVLGEATGDEIAAARKVLGDATKVVGFYSYGEICPSAPGADCELHNQTMTITTFREK